MIEASLYLNCLMTILAFYARTLVILRHATNTYGENVATSWMISSIKKVKTLNYFFIFFRIPNSPIKQEIKKCGIIANHVFCSYICKCHS